MQINKYSNTPSYLICMEGVRQGVATHEDFIFKTLVNWVKMDQGSVMINAMKLQTKDIGKMIGVLEAWTALLTNEKQFKAYIIQAVAEHREKQK